MYKSISVEVDVDVSDVIDMLDPDDLHQFGLSEIDVRSAHKSPWIDVRLAVLRGDRAGGNHKILPASVVNAGVADKVRKIAEAEGRRVGSRERKRIKQAVFDELMPRAFSQPSSLQVWLDLTNGWAAIDTSSRKAAESAISMVREALGSFPAVPLAPERSVRQVLTHWLQTGDLPPGLVLGDECELRDAANAGGAVTRSRHQELESDEIREHLRAGKQVYQLGLEFDERLGFVLDEALTVRKLKLFDVVEDQLDTSGAETIADDLGARVRQLETFIGTEAHAALTRSRPSTSAPVRRTTSSRWPKPPAPTWPQNGRLPRTGWPRFPSPPCWLAATGPAREGEAAPQECHRR